MKKQLNYLSLPDYVNKFLTTNFNQKANLKKSVLLHFKMSNQSHLGSSLKAIYLLEIIFPIKSFVIKILLKKKKKIYFGQKTKKGVYFSFNLYLSSIQFIDFFRFFNSKPFKLKQSKIDENIIVNKKLKQFEFNSKLFFSFNKLDSSFMFLHLYHLN